MTEKFLMARNFFRIFTENNPVMGDSKTLCIPEAKGLSRRNWNSSFLCDWKVEEIIFYLALISPTSVAIFILEY